MFGRVDLVVIGVALAALFVSFGVPRSNYFLRLFMILPCINLPPFFLDHSKTNTSPSSVPDIHCHRPGPIHHHRVLPDSAPLPQHLPPGPRHVILLCHLGSGDFLQGLVHLPCVLFISRLRSNGRLATYWSTTFVFGALSWSRILSVCSHFFCPLFMSALCAANLPMTATRILATGQILAVAVPAAFCGGFHGHHCAHRETVWVLRLLLLLLLHLCCELPAALPFRGGGPRLLPLQDHSQRHRQK